MIANHVYLIQSQIISLGELPFLPKTIIRPAFHDIFINPYCFTKMRTSILDNQREYQKEIWQIPLLPSKPFLRNLGQICFNTNSIHMLYRDPFLRPAIAEQLAGCEYYWDPDALPERPDRTKKFFGYDLSLEDQRMYQLHFELRRPIYLKAVLDGQTMADGNIFVHLYPSGYLVIYIAIDLKQPNLASLDTLKKALLATRPGKPDTAWTWQSRLGHHVLKDTIESIRQNTYASIYRDPKNHTPNESSWHFALKIITNQNWETFPNRLFPADYEGFEIVSDQFDGPTNEAVVTSHQGMISVQSPTRTRRDALRAFWNYLSLYEFALLKDQIYTDYASFLRAEIVKLREYRLSTVKKLTEEDFKTITVYKPEFARYLLALDNHIQNAPSFHRLIYAKISDGTGFSRRRLQVKQLLAEWETEVSQWEHSVVLLWKRVASPLRTLLGLK